MRQLTAEDTTLIIAATKLELSVLRRERDALARLLLSEGYQLKRMPKGREGRTFILSHPTTGWAKVA